MFTLSKKTGLSVVNSSVYAFGEDIFSELVAFIDISEQSSTYVGTY
jgi:hypothetical protein